jgi:hypothetical protein
MVKKELYAGRELRTAQKFFILSPVRTLPLIINEKSCHLRKCASQNLRTASQKLPTSAHPASQFLLIPNVFGTRDEVK